MLEVEFVGGPYDGHSEPIDSGPPAEELAWLVSKDVYRLLDGKDRRECGTITSVAIYTLEVDDGLFQYRFLRSISFKELVDSLRASCMQLPNGEHK